MEKTTILRSLQLSILKIFTEIYKICNNNNINFFLDAGSLLGAIRHNGFIPWDDDGDVIMMRQHYEKFKSLCLTNTVLSTDFELQCYENDHQYSDGFIRIRLNNTKCVIPYHKERGYKNLGVFVDIFPLDLVPKNSKLFLKHHQNKITFINRIIVNKLEINHFTKRAKIIHFLLKPISANYLINCREKIARKYNNRPCKYVVSTYSSYSLKRVCFNIELVQVLTTHIFENQVFPIPKEYNKYLSIMYGDYMKLPPKEKQIAHLPSEIEL